MFLSRLSAIVPPFVPPDGPRLQLIGLEKAREGWTGADPLTGRGRNKAPAENAPHVPTSSLLEWLLREVPADCVTAGWVTDYIRKRSFAILLLSGVCAVLRWFRPPSGARGQKN